MFVETLCVSYCSMCNILLRITQTTKLLQSSVTVKKKLGRGIMYSSPENLTGEKGKGGMATERYFNMYRWHITDPIYFKENLRVTIQALGWRHECDRYLPLRDDISSVAYWYSDTLDDEYPPLPNKNDLEII